MIFNDDPNDPIARADEESGEESVSGSSPAPGTDADTGEMMQEITGIDPDPNMDNAPEVGLGEDIDAAEEKIRKS